YQKWMQGVTNGGWMAAARRKGKRQTRYKALGRASEAPLSSRLEGLVRPAATPNTDTDRRRQHMD
ncbi:uncharacterized protein SCHCODRAFT_01092436, partial [Schizophyllum commune H4-8]|uniref:uncharacterized protein n=1 Tax=Schizophyllum commune (strain H4-8 / FGSC 9210) TaxID=578458 RepID=UPI00215EA860